jgi:hypothetical protein
MDELKVGESVCWRRAEQWKLKDRTGTVSAVFKEGRDQRPVYQVKFAFGILRLDENQIERLRDKP